MGKTKIEWTDFTFNPWIGCTKVSPACDNCYAATQDAFRKWTPEGWGGPRKRTSDSTWRNPIKWDKEAARAGKRARVFCASLADVFDNQVPDEWRADLWQLIQATPNLDWLLLTKRPQNIAKMLPKDWGNGWPGVWLGTTAENQEEFDRRFPHITNTPAEVWFISYEPALGPINTEGWAWAIDWLICGGESGPGKRPMNLEWARSMRDQCKDAGVSFFMKQIDGVKAIPDDLMIRDWPKSHLHAPE